MTFTFHAPVPAQQIRELPTRDVALLLLQHLSSGNGRALQLNNIVGPTAARAYEGEPDVDALG
ncbi:hypothetical protein [Streptomyces sp. SAI-25]|uniref:hypothetical protein n=1 Tax=Streptomyces sp. SAI-25 TaxID=1472664 RepID=UPI00403964CB